MPEATAWPACIRHDGAHLNVYGQCVHRGAPVAIRVGPCPDAGCGRDVAFSRNLASGRVTVLEEGSDERHVHPLPIRVEIDQASLAEGIAGAIDGLMERRREERAARRENAAPEATSADREPTDDLPSIDIWGDDGGPA